MDCRNQCLILIWDLYMYLHSEMLLRTTLDIFVNQAHFINNFHYGSDAQGIGFSPTTAVCSILTFFFFFSRIFTWSQLGWETDLSWSWLCLCALTWVITKLKAQGVCFKPLPLRKLNHLFKVQQQTFGLVLTLSHIKFNNF